MPNINVNLPEQLAEITGPVEVFPVPGAVFDVNVVNGPGPTAVATPLNYAEITGVTAGVETIVVTYTAPPLVASYLIQIEAAGINNAIYTVYRNASVIDRKYTTYGAPLNVFFEFRTDYSSVPGVKLVAADVITITVLQESLSLGTFNAKIQAVEVG